ncbi:MAG: response regulator [Desulfococcaceae bacterium]
MKFIITAIFCILAFCPVYADQGKSPVFTAEEKAWIAAHPVIRVGFPEGFPPGAFRDRKGRPAGLLVDYIRLVSERSGIHTHAVFLSWPDLVAQAKDRRIDMFIGNETAERTAFINFSKPIMPVPTAIVNRSESPFIMGLESLKGRDVAVVRDTITFIRLQQDYPEIHIIPVELPLEGLECVSSGKTEAYVGYLAVSEFLIQKQRLSSLKVAALTGYPDIQMGFAVRKDWPELSAIIDKILASISPGDQAAIMEKWLRVPYDYRINWTAVRYRLLIAGGLCILILAMALIWNRRLAKEITERRHVEKALQDQSRRLNERVKELKCLYGISSLVSDAGLNHALTWEKILTEIVAQIPPACHDPEITGARLVLDGLEVRTGNFSETPQTLKQNILVNGELAGVLEVCHPDENAEADNDPFYPEEHHLINAIAELLGRIAGQRCYEKREKRRHRYEAGLSACSRTLLANGPVEEIMGAAIGHLLAAAEVHRVYIFENFDDPADGLCMRQICEICAGGIKAEIGNPLLQHLPYSELGFLRAKLAEGENYSGIVAQFPLAERGVLEAQGIVSILILPVFVRENWYGFIGFDDCVQARNWAEEEIRMLRTAADMLGTFVCRKQTEAELEKAKTEAESASRSKSEFLARMSHEIRTPMNAVMGLTHLAMQTELTARQHDYLRKIKSASESLLGIINDILDFSKIEAGKMEMESAEFNLDEVFDSLSDMVRLKAEEKGIEMIFSLADNVPRFLIGDPLRLGQILLNLTSNSLKFTESGEIAVRAEISGEPEPAFDRVKLRFSVRDTGIGISPEKLSVLFDPFTQADGSVTRKFGGTGLGLAICKRLSGMMGGEIHAESKAGQGSTFTFTAEFKRQTRLRKKRFLTPPELVGIRVLVADDNSGSRDILNKTLSSFSFDVVSVESGDRALAIIEENREHPFCLVFLDWNMPNMDGIETAKRIKDRFSPDQIPKIILVTGYGEKVMEQTHRHLLDAVLVKPVSRSVIFQTILEVMGQKQTEICPPKKKKKDTALRNRIRGTRVLLVEDNRINQQVAAELLQSEGLSVQVANNGKEALQWVRKSGFDLIFMDIQMPEMDGYEATEEIRKWEAGDSVLRTQSSEPSPLPPIPKIPIIAMTAHAMSGEREKCLACGMDDFISKPIDPERLISVLSRWIRNDRCQCSENAVQYEFGEKDNRPAKDEFSFQLPGIDTGAGLKRVAGNRSLFRKLLLQFYQDYRDTVPKIRTMLEQGNAAEVRKLAHTIKGVSGNMGAQELFLAAGQLESAIRTDQSGKYFLLWEKLAKELSRVLHSIKMMEKIPYPENPEHSSDEYQCTSEISDLIPILNELRKLLREGDAEVLEKTGSVKAYLKKCGLAVPGEQLAEQIYNYEFGEARETLEKILLTLQNRK